MNQLNQYIDDQGSRSFRLGSNDCIHFVVEYFIKYHGKRNLVTFIKRYEDRKVARITMRDYGKYIDLVENALFRCGFELTLDDLPENIVLAYHNNDIILGIRYNEHSSIFKSAKGILGVPNEELDIIGEWKQNE